MTILEKRCFKCGRKKALSLFYAHPKMADGHLGKCKSCTKKDVRTRYEIKALEIQAWDRERSQKAERKKAQVRHLRAFRSKYPQKAKAWSAVSRAIQNGRLKRQACAGCGSTEKVQAHHHNYQRPLDVEWLCFGCHRRSRHGQKHAGSHRKEASR